MGAAWMRQARDRQRRYVDPHQHGDIRDQAKQAYAAWFEPLDWHTFDTLTLAQGGRESARFIWDALDRWRGKMHRLHGRQLLQAVALEWQNRGTAHLHALTFGYRVVDLHQIHTARQLWAEISAGGFAKILPYELSGGAASYCSKYVSKDMELRLLGPWRKYAPFPA